MFKVVPRDASEIAPATVPMAAEVQSAAARLLVAAMLLALLSATALAVDLPLARWFSEHALPGEVRRLVRLSEAFAWGGTVALIILAAARLDPRGWRVVPRLAIGAFGAGLLADAIKLLVARTRPTAANLDGPALDTFVAWLPAWHAESHGHKLQSFPSAHTATAVGLAIGLAALYPRGRWLFAFLAVLAGVQRLEGQAHFLSDVLAGAAIGCLFAAFYAAVAVGSCWRESTPITGHGIPPSSADPPCVPLR